MCEYTLQVKKYENGELSCSELQQNNIDQFQKLHH